MNQVHSHMLIPAHPKALYNDPLGRWKCDVCKTMYNGEQCPQHCSLCSFDACQSCLTPQMHPGNKFPLLLSNMMRIYPQYNGKWKCDTCFNVFHDQEYAYHCLKTGFDMCKQCFQGRSFPIHAHSLKPAKPRIIYGDHGGGWQCDGCKKRGTELATNFAWHCAECQFDACPNCLKPEEFSVLHNHQLQLSQPSVVGIEGQWKCDCCEQWKDSSELVYHCFACQFHSCVTCCNEAVEPDLPNPIHPPRPVIQEQHPMNFHIPPVEEDQKDPDELLDNIPESERCKVCFEKRAIATFLHGRTGHTCTCMSCAYTIFHTDGKCPICREPVSGVIRNFTT